MLARWMEVVELATGPRSFRCHHRQLNFLAPNRWTMLISVGYGSVALAWQVFYQTLIESHRQHLPLRGATTLSELQLNLMNPLLLLPVIDLLSAGRLPGDILRGGEARCTT
jgi:hypothetical protein